MEEGSPEELTADLVSLHVDRSLSVLKLTDRPEYIEVSFLGVDSELRN